MRAGRLCSFGALEDWITIGDARRLKVFALAFVIALVGTQALVVAGLLDPAHTTYVPAAVPIVGIVFGSLAFGVGMSLVGTCGLGSLVRLGGGDLRSLVVVLVFAGMAYAALRGSLNGVRIDVIERIRLPMPDGTRSDLPALIEAWSGTAGGRLAATGLLVAPLIVWILRDRRLLRTPRMLAAGMTLGFGVVAGWAATTLLADEFAAARPQSLTFVGPVARAVLGLVIGAGDAAEFGAASVFGVIAGSWIAARAKDQFHWEAFDDQREMRRHIAGAALMGLGGVAAGGCTIGQGLTAGSLLAVSWPFALAGLYLGGRFGIAFILEGRLSEALRSLFSR
ncbi:YeeE/YedE family protein [Hyphomicrobiaceae bacterium 22]|uniref:YeeE/YedE family protein n=2 Tax=Prosthecodimorpha staleyi TaxID=2840188 RepID=A0A947GC99_9HYPH|nr:YeeE/YedE family protein [Prosthecodimorpha staleyi]